jgi:probable phosphoglycerate mutase
VTVAVTRLVLWRHGQTEWNAGSRFQGQTDVPLNEIGRAQAAQSAARLAALRPDALISSDLGRAAETAAALAEVTDLEATYDTRLRERFFGAWEGLTMPEIEARWPDGVARWRTTGAVEDADVESPDALAKRFHEALREVVEASSGGTLVVASHGGAIRAGIAAVLDWPPPVLRTLGAVHNCHWSELLHHPVRGWQLHSHNVGGA